MTSTTALFAEEYLAQLPADRRPVIETVRDPILRCLPPGYEERIRYGMLSYEVPLERYPNTHNGQPLAYVGLAAQKLHFALYLMGAYADVEQRRWLEEQFVVAGKKFDMGKSCLRFRSVDHLPLESVGKVIASTSVERFISLYEASRQRPSRSRRRSA